MNNHCDKRVFIESTRQGADLAMLRLLDELELPATAKQIAIKPNFCDYRGPETGVVTTTVTLQPMLAELRRRYPAARIILFEHDATGTDADTMVDYCNLRPLLSEFQVEFLNLRKDRWRTIRVDGYRFRELEVPETVVASDLVINHPKLKTHGRTKMTCGLKNIFACHFIKNKTRLHPFLDEAIVDINLAVRSDIVIVDGILGVEGNRGPTQGFPARRDILIGGRNVVSVDALAARVMGFWPLGVRHLRMAWRKGLGSPWPRAVSDCNLKTIEPFQFSYSKYMLLEMIRKALRGGNGESRL